MTDLTPTLTSQYKCEEPLDTDVLVDSIGGKNFTSNEGSPNSLGTARRYDGSVDASIISNANRPFDSGEHYYAGWDFIVTNVHAGVTRRFWRPVTAGLEGPFVDWDGTNNRFRITTQAAGGSSVADANIPGGLTLNDRLYLGIGYNFSTKVPIIVVVSTGGLDVSATGAAAATNSITNADGFQLFKLSTSNRTQADLNEFQVKKNAIVSIVDMQDTANGLLFPSVPDGSGKVISPMLPSVFNGIISKITA